MCKKRCVIKTYFPEIAATRNKKPIAPTSPVVDDALPPPHLKTNDRYAKNKKEEEEEEDDGAYTDDDFEEATPKVQRDMSSQENNATKSKPKKGGKKANAADS